MRLAFGIALAIVLAGTCGLRAAEQTCKEYDLTGVWSIQQANGPLVEITAVQSGTNLAGAAKSGAVVGTFAGKIEGRDLSFRVDWTNGTAGVYLGEPDDFDFFSGVSYEADNKANNTGWKMTAPAKCEAF